MKQDLINQLIKFKEIYRSIKLSDREIEVGWQNLYQRLHKQHNSYYFLSNKYFLFTFICLTIIFISAIFFQPDNLLYSLKSFSQNIISVIPGKNKHDNLAKPMEIPKSSERPGDSSTETNSDLTADEKNATDSSNVGGFYVEKIFTSPSTVLDK